MPDIELGFLWESNLGNLGDTIDLEDAFHGLTSHGTLSLGLWSLVVMDYIMTWIFESHSQVDFGQAKINFRVTFC